MRTSLILIHLVCAVVVTVALENTASAQTCTQVMSQFHPPPGHTLATSLIGPGPWYVYSAGAVTGGTMTLEKEGVAGSHDFCTICGPASAAVSSSVTNTDTDTVSISASVTLTAELTAEIGNAAIGKLGLKEGISFTVGSGLMASKSEALMHSVTVTRSAPPRYIAKVNTQIWGMHGRKTSVHIGRFSKSYRVRYYNAANNSYTDANPNIVYCDPEWTDVQVDNPKACRSFPMYITTYPDQQCSGPGPTCGSGSGSGSSTPPGPGSGSGSSVGSGM